MDQISGCGMMRGNLHAVVWTGASSSLHQTKAEWLISRKLSVTLTGKVGQATAVVLGWHVGAYREKNLQTEEGWKARRLEQGARFAVREAHVLFRTEAAGRLCKRGSHSPRAMCWSELGK